MASSGLTINYEQRITDIQERIRADGFDAAVITRSGAVNYIAGVIAPWRTAVVLTTDGRVSLVTNKYDADRIGRLTWIDTVKRWEMGGTPPFSAVVARQLDDWDVGDARVGVELDNAQVPGVLSAAEYLDLEKDLPGVELANVIDLVDEIMMIKTPAEIERLRRASEITDCGIEAAMDALEPGISELTLTGIIEQAMRKAGSEYNWSVTQTEVGSGYRQAFSEGFTVMPSEKQIQRGDLVTFDLHSTYRGYFGDFAINACVGQPSPEQAALAAAWQTVVDTLLEELGPGKRISDVAAAAERAAEGTDYAEHFISFFGHGLGTTARIEPTIVPSNENELQPNSVVVALTYVGTPDIGGMRLEVPVLITESGTDILAKTPLELLVKDLD